jgi:hypothetical protein
VADLGMGFKKKMLIQFWCQILSITHIILQIWGEKGEGSEPLSPKFAMDYTYIPAAAVRETTKQCLSSCSCFD